MSFYTHSGEHLIVRLRVQPRARRQGVVGPHGEALKIALAAPPVDGKANAALIAFLARELGVAKSDVQLLSGENAREKRVRVPATCEETLKQWGSASTP